MTVHILRHKLRHPSAGERRPISGSIQVLRRPTVADSADADRRLHPRRAQGPVGRGGEPAGALAARAPPPPAIAAPRRSWLRPSWRSRTSSAAAAPLIRTTRQRAPRAAASAEVMGAIRGLPHRCARRPCPPPAPTAATPPIAYNSCRNRHCPGVGRAEAWVAAWQGELLPVPCFHVVFTLPAPIGALAFQNKAAVYAMLFRAAAETLRLLAAEPPTSAPRSAASPCCIPGTRRCSTIRTSTASCRAAASRTTAGAGSPAHWVLPIGQGRSPVPAPVSRRRRRRLRRRRAALPRRSRPARRSPRLRHPLRGAAPDRLGGLRQTALRRPRAGAGLSRPLHPPRRHRQQPARRHHRRHR